LYSAAVVVTPPLYVVIRSLRNVLTKIFYFHHIAPIECSPESLDLFVVIDGSRSVGYVNFGKVKTFLKKLADEFLIGKNNAHFGVLQYGDKRKSRIEFNLDKHFSNKNVSQDIEEMEFLNSPRTDTGHALSVVNEQVRYCIMHKLYVN
jgi:hypothetical protein